ncbi:hypothetical protein MPER_01354, partial [Moniliophthora perniciosa FA553]
LMLSDPKDFFTRTDEQVTEEMEEELERLTECLGLYYVLIVRDKKNRTGIRDKDNLANVERDLLKPMRHWLRIRIENFSTVKEEGGFLLTEQRVTTEDSQTFMR